MKQLIQCFFFLFFSVSVGIAQNAIPVDYDAIEENISNENSNFYYPTLLARFEQGDSTLQVEDLRHLYYGFTFQDAYRPYDQNPLNTEIAQIMAGMTTEDVPVLQKLATNYLEQDPFSLKMIYYLMNFNTMGESEIDNTVLQQQFDGIVEAILSSGNGQTIETAYTVNHPSDEYMVLRSLNLQPVENKVETTYDYFQLAENSAGIEEIYFDVDRMATVGTRQIGITTVEIEDEEIPEDAILIGTEEEMQQLIPLGYKALFQKQVDFDEDGDKDWIVVTKLDGEETVSNYANGSPELRELLLLERTEDNQLQVAVRTKTAVPCYDCGGSDDPFVGITAEPKAFIITTKGGELFQWERASTFELQEDTWLLTKEEFSSYRKGKEEDKQSDVETSADFGTVTLSEFNYYDLLD